MKIHPSTHSPLVPGDGDTKNTHYVDEIPAYSEEGLEPGDRNTYFMVSKKVRSLDRNDRYTWENYWLARIEKVSTDTEKRKIEKWGGGITCYTWTPDKEKGLKFRHIPEAREAAQKAKGQVKKVIRVYRGNEDEDHKN